MIFIFKSQEKNDGISNKLFKKTVPEKRGIAKPDIYNPLFTKLDLCSTIFVILQLRINQCFL